MNNPSRERGMGRILVIIAVAAIVAAAAYMVISQTGGSGSVPDQTNDEMEVAPS
jgi:beta-lactam-binding protein with PASTA domain